MNALLPELTAEISQYMSQHPEVVAAYLFGSQAKGTAHVASDLDIALLLDPAFDLADRPLYRLEQMTALAELCYCQVDVVILNQAALVLRHQVLKYGKLVFERDHRQRIDFEVRSLALYYDFLPTLKMFNEKLTADIKEKRFGNRYRGRRDPLSDARRAFERFERLTADDVSRVQR